MTVARSGCGGWFAVCRGERTCYLGSAPGAVVLRVRRTAVSVWVQQAAGVPTKTRNSQTKRQRRGSAKKNLAGSIRLPLYGSAPVVGPAVPLPPPPTVIISPRFPRRDPGPRTGGPSTGAGAFGRPAADANGVAAGISRSGRVKVICLGGGALAESPSSANARRCQVVGYPARPAEGAAKLCGSQNRLSSPARTWLLRNGKRNELGRARRPAAAKSSSRLRRCASTTWRQLGLAPRPIVSQSSDVATTPVGYRLPTRPRPPCISRRSELHHPAGPGPVRLGRPRYRPMRRTLAQGEEPQPMAFSFFQSRSSPRIGGAAKEAPGRRGPVLVLPVAAGGPGGPLAMRAVWPRTVAVPMICLRRAQTAASWSPVLPHRRRSGGARTLGPISTMPAARVFFASTGYGQCPQRRSFLRETGLSPLMGYELVEGEIGRAREINETQARGELCAAGRAEPKRTVEIPLCKVVAFLGGRGRILPPPFFFANAPARCTFCCYGVENLTAGVFSHFFLFLSFLRSPGLSHLQIPVDCKNLQASGPLFHSHFPILHTPWGRSPTQSLGTHRAFFLFWAATLPFAEIDDVQTIRDAAAQRWISCPTRKSLLPRPPSAGRSNRSFRDPRRGPEGFGGGCIGQPPPP